MSLPESFAEPAEYFEAAVTFLKSYSWVYEYANTCFLKAGVLELMPNDFKDYFTQISNEDLNEFPLLYSENFNTQYDSINKFRHKLKTLIPKQSYAMPFNEHIDSNLPSKCFLKMNAKKRHEIANLAKVITAMTQDSNYILIDFGAGLGYLCEMLNYHNANCFVLGLEADAYRVAAAQKRQAAYMPQTVQTIQYKHAYITEASSSIIEESVQQLVGINQTTQPQAAPQLCIIGLHACADLTITSMKLFLQMQTVRKLVIMPCCYHKLTMANTQEFVNFPLSTCLRRVVRQTTDTNHCKQTNYFNRPFLRLACQQTIARWLTLSEAEHLQHANEMFWRAIAETIIDGNEIIAKRKFAANSSSFDINSFQQFCMTFALKSKESKSDLEWQTKHSIRFEEMLQRYAKNGTKLAEGLTCLQTTLQKLCENIVLYDRLCFLYENAFENHLKIRATFQKLFNEKLSPRCYVLIAEKV